MINFLLFRGGEYTALEQISLNVHIGVGDILYSFVTRRWYINHGDTMHELKPEQVPPEHRVLLLIFDRNQT